MFRSQGRPGGGSPRGFSLVEVLLAIFILGIGMIMVASIFPVGANWTRQATEETVGQAISQNALTVIEQHYGPGGYLRGASPRNVAGTNFLAVDFTASSPNTVLTNSSVTPFGLQALPGFTLIPLNERCYQFGSSAPFPAGTPVNCTYFWTALCRLNPSQMATGATSNVMPASSYKYDIYILVFRKGDRNHQFQVTGSTVNNAPLADTWSEVPNMRTLPAEDLIPYVASSTWRPGTYTAGATPPIVDAVPPIGTIGIGKVSGTVFRQGFDPLTSAAIPRPLLIKTGAGAYEDILWSPGPNHIFNIPAAPTRDMLFQSPLIYVYQTTLTL
jgi:prepilin-type N-terminal cleavage/methylation domain-containing protein